MSNKVKQTFYLDSPIKDYSSITLKVTSNKSDPSLTGYIVGGRLYEWEFTATDDDSQYHIADLFGIDLKGKTDEVYGKVYFRDGRIELYFDASPPVEGADNITVEFEAHYSSIPTSPYRFDFETEHTGTLFFKGHNENDPSESALYFTDTKSKLYLPVYNYININYTGLIPLGDNTIGAFTKEGITYLIKSEETVGNSVKNTYRSYVGQNGEMLISKESIAVLANDPLFLSVNGVYALKLNENIKSNERYALERSGTINSLLTKHADLSAAKGIVWKNRYYLAIDDVVYIADARYKTSGRDEDMSDTFNYEWWVWNDIRVNKWFVVDNELMFINADNKLCKFVDERVDSDLISVSSGGESLGYFAPISNSQYAYQFNMIEIDLLKEGNIIKVYDYDDNIKRYIIKNVDSTKGTFYLQRYEDVGRDVYVDNSETLFWPRSQYTHNFGEVYLINKKNVVSEWYTPIINMGTDLFSKNLLSSTLVFEPNIEGDVKFGYLTRKRDGTIFKESSLSPSNGFDFSNIDFTDFSFAVGFAASRTLKTRVRNFNYIQFRIVSDTNEDCALNHFTITYNIGRKNKGVR